MLAFSRRHHLCFRVKVFISKEPLNYSIRCILQIIITEYTKGKPEITEVNERKDINLIEAIKAGVCLVELRESCCKVNDFINSFGGVLNQESVDRVQRMIAETVTDNVHKTNFKNLLIAYFFLL